MDRSAIFLVLLGVGIAVVSGQKFQQRGGTNQNQGEECGECNPAKCDRPNGCVAGLVKDECNCCEVCGKAEFELCDHPEVPRRSGESYGMCGDNLMCRVREDLDDEEGPEAICYCMIEGTLCGSDGLSYDNLCQLMAAGVRANTKITVNDKGACNEPAKIIFPPENAKNRTGESVAIVCEARGYPIPTVEWTWTRVDGETQYLPSDDLRVSVNMRGGPERWQVTGWLQIMDLAKEHEGDYTCLAQNKHGMDEASARINVVGQGDEKKTRSKPRRN